MAMCEMCENYRYDEDLEEYFCDIELDEDEYLKFLPLPTTPVLISELMMNTELFANRIKKCCVALLHSIFC